MTRRLSDQERQLLQAIRDEGGSFCPSDIGSVTKAGHQSLRRMERPGLLRIEDTEAGARFHLTSLGRQEAEHG